MADPRLPSSPFPREFEEVEFVHPDGTIDILEFDKGTPDEVMVKALRQYGEQVSGQRGIPPIEEFGRMTAAEGALTGLDRAQSGVTPAPAPVLGGEGGFFEKPDEYLGHLAKAVTWDQAVEALTDPAGYAKKIGEIISAPSHGIQHVLSGGQYGAPDESVSPFARALEAGVGRAASFAPAAAGVLSSYIPGHGTVPQDLVDLSMAASESAGAVPIEGPRSVFEIDSPEAMTDWIFNMVGEQAPIMAGLVGVGTLGGPAALMPASMGMETGIIAQQQERAGYGVDPNAAVIGGAVAGALEAAPIMNWLKRTSLGDDAVRWVGSRLQAMTAQTAEEMPTEYLQELVEALATQFVAGNKDQINGREWEEALRVIKETQPEAVGAAAAAGVVGPLMGAFGGGGQGISPQQAFEEIRAAKLAEIQAAQKVQGEIGTPQVPRRGIADIIASTLAQAQQPPPDAVPGDVPPTGAPAEVVGGPVVPPVVPMEPIVEEQPPAPAEPEAPQQRFQAAHQFKDTGETVITGPIHQMPVDENGDPMSEQDVELGFFDTETGNFLTRKEALDAVNVKKPVSESAKAGTGLGAEDLTHGEVEYEPAEAPPPPPAPKVVRTGPETIPRKPPAAKRGEPRPMNPEWVVDGNGDFKPRLAHEDLFEQMEDLIDNPNVQSFAGVGDGDSVTVDVKTSPGVIDRVVINPGDPKYDAAKAIVMESFYRDRGERPNPNFELFKADQDEQAAQKAPPERRAPERAEIPSGLRGDEAARMKDLLRQGKADEAEAFADEIVKRAETDSLTGLRNQGAHERAVDQAPEGSSHSYIDLDDFKEINDTFGHDVGDEALRRAAEIIAEETRDIEGFEGFRRGGDEFAILAAANQDQLEDVSERIRQRISEIEIDAELSDGTVEVGKVGASYGIGQTLKEADAALFKDKETKGQRRETGGQAAGQVEPEAERVDGGVDEAGDGGRPGSEVQDQAAEEGLKDSIDRGALPRRPEVGETWFYNDEPVEIMKVWNIAQGRNALKTNVTLKWPDGHRHTFVGDKELRGLVPERENGEKPKAVAEPGAYTPSENDTEKLARLWADTIVDNPVDILRDETAREDFVQEIIDTIADPDDTRTQALGQQLEEMPERDLIQMAQDAYEGKEARSNKRLPFAERVKAAAKKKRAEKTEPELSPAGGALNVITRDLEKWEARLDDVIEKVRKKPFNLVDFARLRSQINDWWDGIPEETESGKMAKEAARERYTALVERLREARNTLKAGEPAPAKSKKAAAGPPKRTVDYAAGVLQNIFASAPDGTWFSLDELRESFLNAVARLMADDEAEAAIRQLREKGIIETTIGEDGKGYYIAPKAPPRVPNVPGYETFEVGFEVGQAPPAAEETGDRKTMRGILKRGATAIAPNGIEYQVKEGPNGWFFEEREDGVTYTKGGAGPNKWSKDLAIDKVLEKAFGPESPEIAPETAPEPEAPKDTEISEPEETAPVPPAPAPSEAAEVDIDTELMAKIQEKLGSLGQGTLTNDELFALADEVYGGTRAEGVYQESDVYDVLEAAANNQRMRFQGIKTPQHVIDLVRKLDELTQSLPKQPSRTKERSDLQQFSTPPSYAAVVAWLANIGETDVVLEPSAGTGNIITQALPYGPARVVGNEISPRRANLLRAVDDVDQVYTYDADNLYGLLHGKENPTVVVMNPPFSRDVKKLGRRQIHVGMRHVIQAVKLLPEGGRVVAIVGGGMSNAGPDGGAHHNSPGYKGDFKKIHEAGGYLKANVRVPGSVYSTHGTSFYTRILVIDKLPEGNRLLIGKTPKAGEVASLDELIHILSEVRNDRKHPTQVPKSPAGEGGRESGAKARAETEEGSTVDSDAATADTGPVARADAGEGRSPSGVSDAAGGEDTTGSVLDSSTVDEAAVGGSDVVEGAGGDESGGPGERAGRGAARRSDTDGQRVQDRRDGALRVDRLDKTADPKKQDEGEIFSSYAPTIAVEGSKPHPTRLSESLIMGSIDLPEVDYTPNLPKEAIESGAISAAQLEPIIYAGAAHSEMLNDGETRKGFFTGDGTGVGKTRIIGGVILDNWNQGRRKAVVLSPDSKLWDDFRGELGELGFPLNSMFKMPKVGEKINRDEGILYITYATLVGVRQGKGDEADVSRLDQVLEWLGDDFDGVIAFDEAHLMGNSMVEQLAIGSRQPSKRGVAGWKFQNAVPNARVLYASATGATEIRNLAFGARLGLWGPGTPFASREDFVNEMVKGGLSAMEIVAQDMKRLGLYLARNLVLDVGYERLTHELTPEQDAMYDRVAEAWQIIYRNVDAALKSTGQVTVNEEGEERSSDAARSAKSRFYGDQQRFFNTFLTSLKTPTLIKAMEADIKAGHSPVIQVKSTGEAALNRALAQNLTSDELQDIEIDSLGIVMHYLESAFPVKMYEEYEDEEGVARTREVINPDTGEPVLDPDAVAMRDRLLDQLGGMKMPELPLDQIINHFGQKKVAEVTGRSKRRVYDDVKKRWVIESRSARHATGDRNAFMEDRKPILVFSMDAGGTGHSYHASLGSKNQRLRRHYVLEGGWRADQAIQALGRTHRSGQKQAPVWILVETNLAGEKRFVSTVARRLQQLGALTKGSREASGQELYSEMDNLETEWAQPALNSFFRSLDAGEGELSIEEFMNVTGLNLVTPQGGLRATGSMPAVPKFMNRVLALPLEQQRMVFDGFMEQYELAIADAKLSGDYDVGTETIKADGARVVQEETVYNEGAAQSRYVQIAVRHLNNPVPFDRIPDMANAKKLRFMLNEKSGQIWAVIGEMQGTDRKTGDIVTKVRLLKPDRGSALRPRWELNGKNWKELKGDEAEAEWTKQANAVPEYRENDLHLVTGALLPIWDRFPEHGKTEIRRIAVDDGRTLLGRLIPPVALKSTLKRLGAGQKQVELTPQELFDRVLSDNYEVTLANDWKFARRSVHGEDRLELIGPDWNWNDPLRNMGVMMERPSGYKNRFFIPTDKTKGPKIVEKVLSGQTIADVSSPAERGAASDDGDFTDNSTEFYSMIDPIGGLIAKLSEVFTARQPGVDPIFIPPALRHQVDEVETRKAAARRGAVEESTREKAAKAAKEMKRSFRGSFEYLNADESATMALTVDILRQYRAAPQFGRALAYDTIRNITDGLSPEAMVLFTDYLALGDIIKDVEDGLYDGRKELPFGYSHQKLGEFYDPERDIEADFARVQAIVQANPKVLAAVQRRAQNQRSMTRKLVELGILQPEVLSEPRYYHRQVLEHLNATNQFPLGATAGVDVHMRKKSFQKKRAGGSDFNLAYHEAEFEYLAQSMAQISKVELLERLKEIHDQVPTLKQMAKSMNQLNAEKVWAEGLNLTHQEARAHWLLHPTEHPTWYYRSRIAIATQRIGKLAATGQLYAPGYEGLIDELADSYLAWQEAESEDSGESFIFDHPRWFQFLSTLAAQPDADIEDNPGPIMAMSVFKNIREREEMIKGALGRRYATWRTLAKDTPGVRTWQPQEGQHFFFGHTVSDKILDQVLTGEKLLQEEDVRDMLIVGGPRETWVIPEGLAATLDNWGPRDEGKMEDAARWLLSSWKQWVLLNPLRATRYNLNNMSGDLDIVLAYDPKILGEFNKAASDLWEHQVKGKAGPRISKEIQDAMRLGVVDSGLTIYEIPDIKKTGAFRALVAQHNPNAFQRAAEGYWHGAKNLTTWRENILRLAAYRYFQKAIADGRKVYGASNRMQVDAIENVNDRAAKLARELVGDYGNISAAGQWLRGHLLPFYSWLEINAPRYVRLMKNLPHEGRGGGRARGAAVAAVSTGRKAAIFAVKVNILFAMVNLWNRLMFPDEDKLINKNRRQLHVILGHRDDGSIVSLRFEGALADALEWFDLDDYPQDIADIRAGKKDWLDLVSEAGKAPINRIIQSWEPFSKTTFELVLGRSAFPTFFEEGKSWKPRTRPIRSRTEHLARTVSMDWLVRKVSRATSKPIPKRPSTEIPGFPKNFGALLDAAVFYRTDPGEAAYWHARDLVIKWQKKHGDEMPSITPTERGNALYYHRKALMWGDEKAADAWLAEYVKLGGKASGYRTSIERQHPLGSLSKRKRNAFVASLTGEQVDEIKAGIKWYDKVYGGK